MTDNKECKRGCLPYASEHAPGGMIARYADGNQEIIQANSYLIELLGCESFDDLVCYAHNSFKNIVLADDLADAEDGMLSQVVRRNGMYHVYYYVQPKTGGAKLVEDFGRLQNEGADGRPVFYSFVSAADQGNYVDWLTGLSSMERFHELAHEEAQAWVLGDDRIAAVAFDLMGMKNFNTRYGRAEGNRLLRSFASVLQAHFGREACSRFSEDHFYAFGNEHDVEQKVLRVFEDFEAAQNDMLLPVRAGICVCDENDDIVEVGFDRAKIACDLDRKTWQSHLNWFTDEMRATERLRIHVLASLDQAIREDWIRPYYQAIVRSATGDICGEEALARWIDPLYGELMPAQFIPVLEEAGLLQKLDMHMVDCALADMATKQSSGVAIVPVSVNISLRDLNKLDVAHEVVRRADAMGVAHNLLRIEFTESAATSDPAYLKEQVDKLHAEGFEVWMDDFGSGYSSLNTLQKFDFDLIKFDMGFLHGDNYEKSKVILEASIRAAGKMGVGTLAEGVETEEQAVFLESVGCDMLQGYYYNGPHSLSAIISSIRSKDELQRERYDEAAYWDAVSLLSFTDLGESQFGKDAGWAPLTETPTGIIEYREGEWRVLRANHAYDEFLARMGILPKVHSNLRANTLTGELDDEFHAAVERCLESDGWERVAGPQEYGSGYQFYVRHIASVPDAQAFLVAAMPTLLGGVLGTYGDLPVAYAVFRVKLNDEGSEVVDAEYVYANEQYCEWGGYDKDTLAGRSFLELYPNASDEWFPYCYRAVTQGEYIQDVIYSPEVGHWLRFHLAPSPIEGCCVYAFTMADDDQREREQIIADRDTSDLIIRAADVLSDSLEFDVAINQVLQMMSQATRSGRLYVLERGEHTTSCTFEWCRQGSVSRMSSMQNIDNAMLDAWANELRVESGVMMASVAQAKTWDMPDTNNSSRSFTAPLYHKGELLGYLGVEHCSMDAGFETARLVKTVASFISARIINHRLMQQLKQMGLYDALTGVLNRRGIDLATQELLEKDRHTPYALALMDVDDFKTVNDVNGHDVGDEALRSLARTIEDVFPEGTILGRNGGDEFLAMIVGDNVSKADVLLHELVSRELYCTLEGRRYPLSMSIGYVDSTQVDTLQHAYSKADAALYAVKLDGKAGVRKYDEGMSTRYRSQLGFTPRDIAENVPGAIVVHIPGDGEILFANDELISLFECDDLDDFMSYTNGTYGGIIHPDDRKRVEEELAAQAKKGLSGGRDYVDFRILTKAGNVRNVANSGKLVKVEGLGEVFYELIVNRDERTNR